MYQGTFKDLSTKFLQMYFLQSWFYVGELKRIFKKYSLNAF